MCDNTWEAVMQKVVELENKDTPVYAKDIGSDGHERWQCPVCGEWWYESEHHNYCHNCGHKIRYK